jgi:hypothetical protein
MSRLRKFTHCFDCRVKIDLAYVANRRGTLEGLCFDCYYPFKNLAPVSGVK